MERAEDQGWQRPQKIAFGMYSLQKEEDSMFG